MGRFRRAREGAVWAFDWYCRLETIGKWIFWIGGGAAALSSFMTFIATAARGLDPLLGIFLAIFAALLVAVLVLLVLEMAGYRKPKKDFAAGLEAARARLAAADAVQDAPEGERGGVAFKDGLLRLLEAVDGTDYGTVIRGTNQGDDALMGYFAASLLLRGQDGRPEVAIYGKREPARISRRIPDNELVRLDWDDRREQLKSVHASEPVRFSGVTLDTAQFEKHLAWYVARANRLGAASL